ncbi:hypothetical protein [Streptomyces sp. NBC_01615]|uniref:hypothetical protein n=1 Tax=Streptomyces sp. NBC_01615 TaxID=2975898 RepID=UPI00386E510D
MTGLDWGTIPAWVSAILTSGSLLLGFYILLRDRRKEERREALKVVCWTNYSDDGGHHVVHVLNTADRPISNSSTLVDLGRSKSYSLEGFHLPQLIAPGEEVTGQEVPRRLFHDKIFPMAVRFTDGDGLEWIRELETGRLYRAPRARRVHLYYELRWRVNSIKRRDWRVLFTRTPSIKRRLKG